MYRKDTGFVIKLLLPATLCILLVDIYPLFKGIYCSFTNYNLLRFKEAGFIGIGNYIELLTQDKAFWGIFGFTFVFVFGTVLFSYMAGLGSALLLNRDIQLKMVSRAIVLLPWVIPTVVACNSWLWILNDQTGFINILLNRIGIAKEPVLFFADPANAKISVTLVNAWKNTPFMILVLMAGLQNIPLELYESAKIDGAGKWLCFRYITMPMLIPVTYVSTILLSVWTFNNFETIYLLTKGGPVKATFVLSIFSYNNAFYRGQMGYASANAVVLMIVMLILSLLYSKALKYNE